MRLFPQHYGGLERRLPSHEDIGRNKVERNKMGHSMCVSICVSISQIFFKNIHVSSAIPSSATRG